MINSNVLIKYIKCPYSELNKHKRKRGCNKWQQEELLSRVCQMSANWSFKVTKLKKNTIALLSWITISAKHGEYYDCVETPLQVLK